jgi:hypothetical protein
MRRSIIALGFAAVLATHSIANAKLTHSENEEVGDPNRVICRTEQQIGTRLQKIRRCHTAAEWAEVKRDNRRVIDRVQAHKPRQE